VRSSPPTRNGSDVRQVTHPGRGVLDTEPDWSPDGTKMVFYRVDPNGCGEDCQASNIYTVNADGSDVTKLTRCSFAATRKGACLLPCGGFSVFFALIS
jgi:hypothetical protein